MSTITIEDAAASPEDRAEIFKLCDNLARTVGIAHIKAFRHRSARTSTLEYRVVLNFETRVPMGLGDVIANIQFKESGFVMARINGKTGDDYQQRDIPAHLRPAIKDRQLLRSWFVQRQMIVMLISEIAGKIVEGISEVENVIRLDNEDEQPES